MASLEQNFPVEHKNPSMRWRIAVSRLRSEAEAKRKKESIQVRSFKKEIVQVRSFKNESIQADISIGEKETSEIQPCSHSPATSPDKYYSCPEAESDDDGALLRSETDSDRNSTSTGGQHVSPAQVNHDPLRRRDGSKIEVLELIFFLANFIVELISIVFDQLSSQHKHKALFLLLCLIMSISAVLISILELVYKLIKERATGKRGWRRCLFDPPSGARVGFFPCITAFTCAFIVLELIILLANFIVELMLIVFEKLSSQHKHKALFLFLCLIMSILAVLISIFELLYKLRKERATWTTVWRRCLFDPPSGARVGLFLCIIALTCAFGQFIITTVNYSLYRKHGNAPIKISICSTIFAFGQLVRGAKTAVIGNQVRVQCDC